MKSHQTRSPNKHAGFTLLEMLLIIAVIGIIGVFAVRFFALEASRSQVRALQQQIAADLQDARSKAQRFSTVRAVRFVSATQYQVLNGATNTVLSTRNVPAGLRILVRTSSVAAPTVPSGTDEYRYFPPFGTVAGNPIALEVGRATGSPTVLTNSMFIKVIGVTGKVISSATF